MENKEIRIAVEKYMKESGETIGDIAKRIGWVTKKGEGDRHRLARRLGIEPETHHGRRTMQERIKRDTATLIIQAIDYDPVSVGL